LKVPIIGLERGLTVAGVGVGLCDLGLGGGGVGVGRGRFGGSLRGGQTPEANPVHGELLGHTHARGVEPFPTLAEVLLAHLGQLNLEGGSTGLGVGGGRGRGQVLGVDPHTEACGPLSSATDPTRGLGVHHVEDAVVADLLGDADGHEVVLDAEDHAHAHLLGNVEVVDLEEEPPVVALGHLHLDPVEAIDGGGEVADEVLLAVLGDDEEAGTLDGESDGHMNVS